MMNWEYYRSFLAVIAEGSLSGAARALGVAQPTIGRHVEALERCLNLVLFTRSQAGLLPTEAGIALKPFAAEMASAAAALERMAASQGAGVSGVVRVTASEVVGCEVLPPIIAALRARHEALAVELVLSNRVQDLLQREADIAVRMTPPRQEQLVAKHVGRVEIGLHARRDYLDRAGTPDSIAALAEHTLIGFDRLTPFLRAATELMPYFRREGFAIRCDSDVAQLALLRAGAGIGFCQTPIARRDPELVRILADEISLPLEIWVTMHEDLRHSPRCRAAFDALAAGFQEYLRP